MFGCSVINELGGPSELCSSLRNRSNRDLEDSTDQVGPQAVCSDWRHASEGSIRIMALIAEEPPRTFPAGHLRDRLARWVCGVVR